MAIPIALTSITVSRPDPTVDGYDPDQAAATPVAVGVRATITSPSATTILTGGVRTEYTFVLNCDPTDLRATDLVVDETTGVAYTVEWAQPRPGIAGLDHVNARLRLTAGAF